jgi:hypothetical protein
MMRVYFSLKSAVSEGSVSRSDDVRNLCRLHSDLPSDHWTGHADAIQSWNRRHTTLVLQPSVGAHRGQIDPAVIDTVAGSPDDRPDPGLGQAQ